MSKRITKETEGRLAAALEEVTGLVGDGLHPNEAVIKVAAAGDFTPGHVRLMVQAYNNGRTRVQQKSSDDVYEKAASFPVADAAVVLEALYPETVPTEAQKQARSCVSADYSRPPTWQRDLDRQAYLGLAMTKLAAAAPPAVRDPERLVKRAFSLLRDVRRELDERRRLTTVSRDKLAGCVTALDRHFRQPGCVPFSRVRNQAVAYIGKSAAAVLDCVAAANKKLEKQAGGTAGPVDWTAEPYRTVQAAAAHLDSHVRLAAELAEFDKQAGVLVYELMSLVKPRQADPTASVVAGIDGGEKFAGSIVDAVKATMAIDLARKVMGRSPLGGKTDEKLDEETFAGLTDPVHEARLTNARRQFMLSNLMANDPVIGGYQPDEVLDVYNQLSQVAPRAAGQEMLVRALLRRHLAQGQVDTHEVDQLANIETKIKQRDDPTDFRKMPTSLPYAPQSPGKTASVLAGV